MKMGLTPNQIEALSALSEASFQRASVISDKTGLYSGAVGSVLKSLSFKGYVDVTREIPDRESSPVYFFRLTRKGKEVLLSQQVQTSLFAN